MCCPSPTSPPQVSPSLTSPSQASTHLPSSPRSLRRLGCNAELIVDEFGEKLLEELDYVQEARNILVREGGDRQGRLSGQLRGRVVRYTKTSGVSSSRGVEARRTVGRELQGIQEVARQRQGRERQASCWGDAELTCCGATLGASVAARRTFAALKSAPNTSPPCALVPHPLSPCRPSPPPQDFYANFEGDPLVKIPWVRRDLSGPQVGSCLAVVSSRTAAWQQSILRLSLQAAAAAAPCGRGCCRCCRG
jgi:hypothetical protein